jgi:myo-inositol-1(or 4)-monophosphatase
VKALVQGLAEHIWKAVATGRGTVAGRYVEGVALGGDAEFPVDVLAERAAWEFLRDSGQSVALYTESAGLRVLGARPGYVLVVDPVDGTRGAAADLEMATVSIAAARYGGEPTIGDVEFALLKEIKSGCQMYADAASPGIEGRGYPGRLPRLSSVTDLERMFWSLEFNGHPAGLMTGAYGHLIDASANRGAVYVFCSASFSISRIITGQMDAYVDIGNRLLRDHPETEADFRRVGHGSILHLFPYDIAASVFLAERAGVTITDAYGGSLHGTRLLDVRPANLCSCIAAATPELHGALLSAIRW